MRPWARAILAGVALAGAMSALSGCATADAALHIVVQSSHKTNDERPFYALVRTVDEKTYLAEPYQSVANQVIAPDASVLRALVIYPGLKREIEVQKPGRAAVAVYFLFTNPGGTWKTLLAQPLPGRVEIRLVDSRIDAP